MAKNSHDLLSKELFSHPEMVQQLLKEFAPPELVQMLNFKTLKKHSGNYITPVNKEKYQDMVWSVELNSPENNKPILIYLYILLEFQSRPDPTMPLRMAHYTLNFYEQLIKEKKLKLSKDLLPPVFPLVLYSGSRKWRVGLELHDLIYKVPHFLRPYQVNQKYFLLDEQQIDREALEAKSDFLNYILLMVSSPDNTAFERALKLIRKHPDLERYSKITRRTLLNYLNLNKIKVSTQTLDSLQESLDMGSVRTRLYDSLVEEISSASIQKGRQEGRQEGRQQGLEEAALNFLRAAAVPIEQLSELLGMSIDKLKALQEKHGLNT